LVLEDELSTEGSTESVVVDQSRSMALRVNNNMLGDWENFLPTMCKLFVEPTTRLAWIDFSFNDLRTIDKVSTHKHTHTNSRYPDSVDTSSQHHDHMHAHTIALSPDLCTFVTSTLKLVQIFILQATNEVTRLHTSAHTCMYSI